MVKVQRPGIDESVRVDLSVLEELGRVIETRTTWGREYHVEDLVAEFSARLREELDYRIEARNAHAIAATMPSDAHIRVPFVYDELSTSRVLVMEWLDGASVREVDWSGVREADRVKLADSLLRTFLEQMLQEGVFHADPHPGNVMLLTDGQLALIDFGAAGRLDPVQQSALRELMAGVSRRDADAVVQAVLQVASLRRGVDVNDFERALARFMVQHLAPGSQPDAAMFNAMLRLMFDYGITMPAEWSTFFRALIVLEGTLTHDRAGVLGDRRGREHRREVGAQPHQPELDAAGGARRAPAHGADAPAPPAPHRPRLHQHRARRPARAGVALLRRARRTGRRPDGQPDRARRALAGAIGLVSVGLIAIDGGPAFSDSTSLFRVFGYFGLFCATVLAMRVIVAVLRDGLN